MQLIPVNQMTWLSRRKFLAEYFKQDLTDRFTDLVILIDKEYKGEYRWACLDH